MSAPAKPKTAAAEINDRRAVLRRALVLEWLTVGWNVVEGLVSVSAGLSAGSVALLGFGIDSFVETGSGLVLLWRLRAEDGDDRCDVERLERRALRLVAASLWALAGWITFDAVRTLLRHEAPRASAVGMAVTAISLAAMGWLARAKKAAAKSLGSRALAADSFQTTACFWMSLTTLVGLGLNALFGWWWADPAAGLAVAVLVASEAREAWRGETCC